MNFRGTSGFEGVQQDDSPESDAIAELALRASQQVWTKQYLKLEIAAKFPKGVALGSLLNAAGPIGDVETDPMVAQQIDQIVSILSDKMGDLKQGLVCASLAGVWLMRAQFGGDLSGVITARQHYVKAKSLVPEDDSSTYQAIVVVGTLLSILDPAGEADNETDITAENHRPPIEESASESEDIGDLVRLRQPDWGSYVSILPPAAVGPYQLFDGLMTSDDKITYIREHFHEMDDNFLLICTMMAETVGREGHYDFAGSLQAVVHQVERLRKQKQEEYGESSHSTLLDTKIAEHQPNLLPGWDMLSMLKHGKQARTRVGHAETDVRGTGDLYELPGHLSQETQSSDQDDLRRQTQLRPVMDFVLEIVKAPDDRAVEALMDTRPDAWERKLVLLIERLEEASRDEGRWTFAARLRKVQDQVLRVRAARPLETLLAYMAVEEESGRPTWEIVEENPILKGWEALERLAIWADQARKMGDAKSAMHYCNAICYLGRYFHANNLEQDTRCGEWERPLRLHLEQRRDGLLERAIQAAAEWTLPDFQIEFTSPLSELPANLAALLVAWGNNEGDEVQRLGPLVEAGLWLCRFSIEALTLVLIQFDMVSHLAEYHVRYPIDERRNMLAHGLAACDEAVELCMQVGLDTAQGYYRGVKGNGLFSVNRLAEAEEEYSRAVDIFRQQADQQPDIYTASWLRTLGNFANVVEKQSRSEEALLLTSDAIARMKDIGQNNADLKREDQQQDLVSLLLIHAAAQYASGRISEALITLESDETLAQALATGGKRMQRDAWAKVLNNYAVMLTHVFRLDEAETKLRQAATIWEQLRAEDEHEYGPTAADSRFNLGNLQLVRRKPKDARDLYTDAIEIYRRLAFVQPEVYNPKLANVLTNLGTVLEDLDHIEAAQETYAEAASMLEELAKETPDVYTQDLTTVLNNQGNLLSSQGEYQGAEAVMRRALTLREHDYSRAPFVFGPDLAGILANLGILLRKTGRREEARKTLERAIELDPYNQDGAKWRATHALARLELDSGNQLAAYNLLLATLAQLDTIRGGLKLRQDLITFQRSEFLTIYRQLVDLCLEMGRIDEAWAWSERSKGRTLLDLISADMRPRLRTAEAQARYEKWQSLDREVFNIEKQLADWIKAQGGNLDRTSSSAMSMYDVPLYASNAPRPIATEADAVAAYQSLAEFRQEASELRRRLLIDLDESEDRADATNNQAQDSGIHSAPYAIPLSAMQLALDLKSFVNEPDEVGGADKPLPNNARQSSVCRALLVDYFLLGENRYVVFLLPLWKVRPGEPLPLDYQVVQMGSEETPVYMNQLVDVTMAGLTAARKNLIKYTPSHFPVGSVVQDYMNSMWPTKATNSTDAYTKYKGITTSEELDDMAKLAGALFEELPVLMSKALFEPWIDKLYTQAPDELLLVPHMNLHLLPMHVAPLGASDELLIERYPISYLSSASMAGLLVKRRNSGSKPTGRLVLGPPDSDRAMAQENGRAYLVHALQEARTVAEKLGVSIEGQPLTGVSMTKDQLRERAGKLEVLHMPTHSRFDAYDYLNSGILFNNSVLTIFEILSDARIDLSGLKLCYLSSCESGLAEVNAGDELQGLVWSLTYAGAEAVMATLWPADDRAARLFALKFYDACKLGMPLREAWRKAIVAARRDAKELSNPYFWAPFVLSGNGFGKLTK